MDFTCLNKAIEKKQILLLRIDEMMDVTAWYALVCFLDAHKGYHKKKKKKWHMKMKKNHHSLL